MSSALDDVRQGSDPLLLHLQQLTEVIAQQNASLASLQTERDLLSPSVTRRRPRLRSFGC
jgi:hypothetical protein